MKSPLFPPTCFEILCRRSHNRVCSSLSMFTLPQSRRVRGGGWQVRTTHGQESRQEQLREDALPVPVLLNLALFQKNKKVEL